MIATEEISIRFGGVVALDRVSVRFKERVCGLVGPNGAGKTSFLNAISGFTRITGGRIFMAGVDVTALSPAARARSGLRRVFQQERINGDLTLRDNVRAFADHLGGGKDGKDVERAIEMLALSDLAQVPGAKLNLFQRRMTELARTLVGDVSVILLDEPGAGLDDTESMTLRRMIRLIVEQTSAQIILIDHDSHLIADVCQETLVLNFGRVLATGPTREVLDRQSVREAYLGVAGDEGSAVH
jgi:branched-chain amino acid transport system ATP-binding protein